MENEMEMLAEEIKEMEKTLMEKKKEFREKRTANLRAALEAKKEAEKAVRDELKALGYSNVNFSDDGWSYRYNAFRL